MDKRQVEQSSVRPAVVALVGIAAVATVGLWVRAGRHVAEAPSTVEASNTAERVQQRMRQLNAGIGAGLSGSGTADAGQGWPPLSRATQAGQANHEPARSPNMQSALGGMQSKAVDGVAGRSAFQVKSQRVPLAPGSEPVIGGRPAPVGESASIEVAGPLSATPMAALNGQEAAETEILTIPATTMQVEGNPKRTGVVGGKVVALYSGSAALSARVEPRLAAVGVSVWGYGQEALGEWPRLLMSVNGEPVGDVVLGSSEENEYYVPIWADPRMPMTVQIRFVNDYYNPAKNEDRNAFIRQLTITTQAHR